MQTTRMLSASELKITEEELAALIWVRDELAAGKINHDIYDECGQNGPERAFQMANAGEFHDCGTVACIGGWMAIHLGARTSEEIDEFLGKFADNTTRLGALFFPPMDYNWFAITPEHAVQAIDRVLSGAPTLWLGIAPLYD